MKKLKLFTCFLLLFLVFGVFSTGYALRNICKKCQTMADPQDIVCRKCQEPLNVCLACGYQNMVETDYCQKCGEMLSEMRVLGSIDPELREELKLGQSDRAQLERELAKLENLLQKEPEKAEIYLYRRAKIFKQMEFFSKEANSWQEYLEKFPNTPRKNRVRAFYSEALRQWGYLFYQQNDMKTALEKFELAAKTNPMNSDAWSWVGRVKMETKNPEGAAEAYLSALKAKPGDKDAIHFLRTLKKKIPPELLKVSKPLVAPPEPPSTPTPAKNPEPAPTVQPASEKKPDAKTVSPTPPTPTKTPPENDPAVKPVKPDDSGKLEPAQEGSDIGDSEAYGSQESTTATATEQPKP